MKDLDIKSLIIGFLAAVLVTVAMGNALAANQVGKYQMAYDIGMKRMRLLDTTTGQGWVLLTTSWNADERLGAIKPLNPKP